MSNWANVDLEVVGRRADVLAFSEQARRRKDYFTPEMRMGEGSPLSSARLRLVGGSKLWKKTYSFQVAHDDEKAHFRRLSRKHPQCWFVIAYGDPNADDNGGHLIRAGRCRSIRLSNEAKEDVYRKTGFDSELDATEDDDDNEVRFWEAQWEMLSVCLELWHAQIPGWPTGG